MDNAFQAVNRWHEWWSQAKNKNARRALGELASVKGEFVLHMTKIPDVMRTKMINAAKRGFTSAESGLWPDLLHFISEHGPVKKANIGYIGKTVATVYVPENRSEEVRENMIALLALTNKYPAECIEPAPALREVTPGYAGIRCCLGWGQARAKFRTLNAQDSDCAPQLKSCFKEIRVLIEKELEACIEDRQPLIDFLYSRQSTVTVPFYTGPEDGIAIGTEFSAGYTGMYR